jgi:hypothetical protein
VCGLLCGLRELLKSQILHRFAMSLHSQLQLIEQTWRTGQHSLLPSLQALFVQSHHDAALAWNDLAWLRLRLSSPSHEPTQAVLAESEALEMLLRAYALRADCWQALDGLCDVYLRRGEERQARQWACASLDAKHALALKVGGAPPTEMARRYANVPSDLKVVAFSLFGREAFYAESAVRNAQDVARFYPGWICRFYVGSGVSATVKARLHQAGAEVVMPPQAQAQLPGTVWRFMAIDDLRVSTVLFRDADSLITLREVQAVQQWLTSECSYHVIRDHLMHSELILAGLWGARTKNLRGVGQALLEYFSKPFHATHADQHFLREWVWPRIWRDVLQHDASPAWHAPQMPVPIAIAPDMQEHIGHAPTQWTYLHPDAQHTARDMLNYQLLDEKEQVLGEYVAARSESGYAVRLPPHVIELLQTGHWRLNALH